jgi:hypothetical protein
MSYLAGVLLVLGAWGTYQVRQNRQATEKAKAKYLLTDESIRALKEVQTHQTIRLLISALIPGLSMASSNYALDVDWDTLSDPTSIQGVSSTLLSPVVEKIGAQVRRTERDKGKDGSPTQDSIFWKRFYDEMKRRLVGGAAELHKDYMNDDGTVPGY